MAGISISYIVIILDHHCFQYCHIIFDGDDGVDDDCVVDYVVDGDDVDDSVDDVVDGKTTLW